MDRLDASRYRNNLAKEIIREPNKGRKRAILANAKLTHEYQDAAQFRYDAAPLKEGETNPIDPLLSYARQHCEQYRALDIEKIVLLKHIANNRDIFKSETLPNAPDELILNVLDFIEGNRHPDIVASLKRANFNFESLLAGPGDESSKMSILLEAILKARSYDDLVEANRNKDIDFSGFENDSDIPDAKDFIYRVFGKDLLQQCLIANVRYVADRVKVRINENDYMLPLNVYQEWERQMPEVKSKKFRGESFVLWNTDFNFSKKFVLTPIDFYSFYGEDPSQLDYLVHVPIGDKMRQYKLGTIAHEVAHHIYDYLMDADKRATWKALVDRSSVVTEYAKAYLDHPLKYDEFFTESVRLKTTAGNYLIARFPEIDKFLSDNFPDITN